VLAGFGGYVRIWIDTHKAMLGGSEDREMTDVAISMFQNKVHTETAFIWGIYSTPLPDATKTVSQLIPSLKIKRLKSFRSWVFRYSQDCHGDIKRSISNEIPKSPTPVSSRISLLPPTCAYYYTGYHGFIDKYILGLGKSRVKRLRLYNP